MVHPCQINVPKIGIKEKKSLKEVDKSLKFYLLSQPRPQVFNISGISFQKFTDKYQKIKRPWEWVWF